MPTLRLFASAREAAGTARAEIEATTVAEMLVQARQLFGDRFGQVLDTSRVWVNGQPADMGTAISAHDVVAVLPPVSGGSSPAVVATEPAATRPDAPDTFVAGPPPPTVSPSPQSAPQSPPPPPPRSPQSAPPPRSALSAPPRSPLSAPEAPDEVLDADVWDAAVVAEEPRASGVRPARSLRPPRRLRLVPPPPADDPSDDWQPHPASPRAGPGSRPTPGSMGRLALAAANEPDPTPEPSAYTSPSPARAPAPAAAPAPSAPPAPDVYPTMAAAVPDMVPMPGPAAEPKPVTPLAVVHHSIRPHGRLGVAWAMVTTGLLVAGPGWLALWLAVIAFVAASQTTTVWRKRGERPLPAFAVAMAAGLPLAAASGLDRVNMVVAGAIALTLIARVASPTKAPGRDVAITLVIGLSVGMAAAAPVLLRTINIPAALYLLACAALYDVGAYLVGTGASSAWEGPAAGVAALIPLTMLAAVALVPPFHGGAPLLLGAVAAVLAPFGPVAGSALLGDRTSYAPALRRLDSLLILGPIWAWCAAALLV